MPNRAARLGAVASGRVPGPASLAAGTRPVAGRGVVEIEVPDMPCLLAVHLGAELPAGVGAPPTREHRPRRVGAGWPGLQAGIRAPGTPFDPKRAGEAFPLEVEARRGGRVVQAREGVVVLEGGVAGCLVAVERPAAASGALADDASVRDERRVRGHLELRKDELPRRVARALEPESLLGGRHALRLVGECLSLAPDGAREVEGDVLLLATRVPAQRHQLRLLFVLADEHRACVRHHPGQRAEHQAEPDTEPHEPASRSTRPRAMGVLLIDTCSCSGRRARGGARIPCSWSSSSRTSTSTRCRRRPHGMPSRRSSGCRCTCCRHWILARRRM